MKKSPLVGLGLTLALLGAALPLVAQEATPPPLPSNGGTIPAATPRAMPPAPTATPGGTPLATEDPANAANNPNGAAPSATLNANDANAVDRLRRLVRDVQTNTENVRAVGNFGAQLYLVADAAFFQEWTKPATPTITPVQLALRGQPIYTAIIFYGPSQDNKGLSSVTYDITVRRPDKTVYTERKGMIGWQTLTPDPKELELGRNYLAINLAPEDPSGLYTVDVVVHDNIARVELPLKQSFVVR